MMPATEHPTNAPSSNQLNTPTSFAQTFANTSHGVHDTNWPDVNGVSKIAEGKQKAQTIMTGKANATSAGQASASASTRNAANESETPRTSRKRSRSGSRIVQESSTEVQKLTPMDLYLDQCIERDALHTDALKAQADHKDALLRAMSNDIQMWKDLRTSTATDPGRIYGEGFAGYGNGWTAQYPTKVIYPAHRKRTGTRRLRELRVSRKERSIQSDQLEELVPIRLDLELEKLRLRDTFTWNIFDRVVPPDLFAEGLVADLKIPPEAGPGFTQLVLQSLQEQILDHHPHPFMEDEALDPHLPYSAYKNDEIRILIKLNITIGQHTLVDQFDWDVNSRLNSPEEFAMHMASDLSLSGEFMTAIAHSIREQCQMYTRSLYIASHPFDGRPVEEAEIRDNMLPSPLPSSFRPFATVKEYTPYFYELVEADMERAELAISREQRLQKRQVTRRGGPAMPDLKERLGTNRSMIVSGVIPGAAESVEKSGIYKPVRVPSGRGRRPYKNDRGDDSEISESEESAEESPVRNPAVAVQGTTRTRGIRGAASAAQAAMRATLAGSMTPEVGSHHHEGGGGGRQPRRYGGYEIREDSATESASFLLRLKMPRAKYRVWWRNYKETVKRREAAALQEKLQREQQQQQEREREQQQQLQQAQQRRQASQTPSAYHGGQQPYNAANSRGSTPQYNGPMAPPPPSTPGTQNRYIPGQPQQQPQPTNNTTYQRPASSSSNDPPSQPHHQRYASVDGTQDSPPPPASNGTGGPTGLAPATPPWLLAALDALHRELPNDSFGPFMRWSQQDRVWQPRIKCNDCTGMLYNTNRADPVGNFRVHLGNRSHRDRVEARIAQGESAGGGQAQQERRR